MRNAWEVAQNDVEVAAPPPGAGVLGGVDVDGQHVLGTRAKPEPRGSGVVKPEDCEKEERGVVCGGGGGTRQSMRLGIPGLERQSGSGAVREVGEIGFGEVGGGGGVPTS